MSDRDKLRRIYEVLDEIRFIKYEDLTKRKLYRIKEEIYDIIIGRNKDEETIFISNKSRYKETIF